MNTKNLNSIVWFDGEWNDGTKPIMSTMSQSYMHGSTIFDGARAYNGSIPDLHKHCERLINSSKIFGMNLPISKEELINFLKNNNFEIINLLSLMKSSNYDPLNHFLISDSSKNIGKFSKF